MKPNASIQLLLEAGARNERTLEGVSCKALFGQAWGEDCGPHAFRAPAPMYRMRSVAFDELSFSLQVR